MTNAERELTMIGFAIERPAAVNWRSERLALPPGATASGQDLLNSVALARWRTLLARDLRPSPYRISRL